MNVWHLATLVGVGQVLGLLVIALVVALAGLHRGGHDDAIAARPIHRHRSGGTQGRQT